MSNPKRPAALCAAPIVAFVATKEVKVPESSETLPVSVPLAYTDKKEVDADPWVLHTVQIRRSTYVALKQAEYWTPGFGQLREHSEEALRSYFTAMPGSKKPLPYKEIVKNKKLQF